MLGVYFPSPTKGTNAILATDHGLGRGGHPKPTAWHQIGAQKRGLFWTENAVEFEPDMLQKFQLGKFYAYFPADQNQPNFTSVGCLVPILYRFPESGISGEWRCLFLKSEIKTCYKSPIWLILCVFSC